MGIPDLDITSISFRKSLFDANDGNTSIVRLNGDEITYTHFPTSNFRRHLKRVVNQMVKDGELEVLFIADFQYYASSKDFFKKNKE